LVASSENWSGHHTGRVLLILELKTIKMEVARLEEVGVEVGGEVDMLEGVVVLLVQQMRRIRSRQGRGRRLGKDRERIIIVVIKGRGRWLEVDFLVEHNLV
jgi:hypothetical protein